MGSCAAPSAKGDDKFITTDYLQQCHFIQVDFDTPWCQPESDVVAALSRRFGCTLEHWYAEQGCNFCGWQLYERGELVDVLWGELEWSSPTDDDELPEVTGPAWIVDKVAHYGG